MCEAREQAPGEKYNCMLRSIAWVVVWMECSLGSPAPVYKYLPGGKCVAAGYLPLGKYEAVCYFPGHAQESHDCKCLQCRLSVAARHGRAGGEVDAANRRAARRRSETHGGDPALRRRHLREDADPDAAQARELRAS